MKQIYILLLFLLIFYLLNIINFKNDGSEPFKNLENDKINIVYQENDNIDMVFQENDNKSIYLNNDFKQIENKYNINEIINMLNKTLDYSKKEEIKYNKTFDDMFVKDNDLNYQMDLKIGPFKVISNDKYFLKQQIMQNI